MSLYVDAPTSNAEARDLLGLPAWRGCTHGDSWRCDCEFDAAVAWWDEHPDLEATLGEDGFDDWYVDGWQELTR